MKSKRLYLKQFYFLIFLVSFCLTSISNAQSFAEKEALIEGNNFYLQKKYDKAKASYTKALATNQAYLKAHYNLGNALYNLKDYSKAQTHYARAAKLSKDKIDRANAYHNLGNALMQQKEFKKAIEAYKNSLRNNPKDNQTRYNLALAKKLLKDKNENKNPPDLPKPSEYAKQMKAKADNLAQTGKFQDALDVMNRAVKKDSTTLHFQNYMQRLDEIIQLDTLQLK